MPYTLYLIFLLLFLLPMASRAQPRELAGPSSNLAVHVAIRIARNVARVPRDKTRAESAARIIIPERCFVPRHGTAVGRKCSRGESEPTDFFPNNRSGTFRRLIYISLSTPTSCTTPGAFDHLTVTRDLHVPLLFFFPLCSHTYFLSRGGVARGPSTIRRRKC